MSDTPLDLDAIRKRHAYIEAEEGNFRIDGSNKVIISLALLIDAVPALLAEVERLTAENAQTGAELARFATEGEWTTEYSVTGRGYWEAERCRWDRFERQVWRGPAQALEGTTE